MEKERERRGRRRVARASGRSVDVAVQRALAELDIAPGELEDHEYEVEILVSAEEGFLGVGGTDAEVEVTLLVDDIQSFAGSDDAEDHGSFEPEARQDAAEGGEAEDLQPEMGSARLRDFLDTVLGHLGAEADSRIVEDAETLHVDITGEDLGIVIGRRGQTLDALEYLANVALYPRPEVRKRIELDVEGYKERRRKTLERLAREQARAATRSGRPVQMDAMTPAERKIVHLALRDWADVSTESEGREPNRNVVITPTRADSDRVDRNPRSRRD